MKQKLTIKKLIEESQIFCVSQSKFQHKELYGVTDGKAVGTLIEQKFQNISTTNTNLPLVLQQVGLTYHRQAF